LLYDYSSENGCELEHLLAGVAMYNGNTTPPINDIALERLIRNYIGGIFAGYDAGVFSTNIEEKH
jgi:hypothetical protein